MLPTGDCRRVAAGILRWALAGALVLLLAGALLKVASGMLPGAASVPPSHSPPQVTVTAPLWSATVLTTDRLITVTLAVGPNRTGTNRFTVKLVALSTGRALTQASVSLFLTMLDMQMATTSVPMSPDGGGQFQGRGELLMGGDWLIRLLIRLLIRTADQRFHEARFHLLTPG